MNGMPTKVLNHKSPSEVLHKHTPDLTYLKTCGCLCFVATPSIRRDKFMSRSTSCIFIGYPYGKKAYKVLDLTTKTIQISKDVIFLKIFSIYIKQKINFQITLLLLFPLVSKIHRHSFHNPQIPPPMINPILTHQYPYQVL